VPGDKSKIQQAGKINFSCLKSAVACKIQVIHIENGKYKNLYEMQFAKTQTAEVLA